jgi:hypothetical protein
MTHAETQQSGGHVGAARRVVLVAVLALTMPVGWARAQANTSPVVSRVHWITIQTRTRGSFDAVFDLFRRDLGLPVYFGPEDHGARRYGAVLAGHVILEPCGPFPDSPFPDAGVQARFHTLTFRPRSSAGASDAGLTARGIEHLAPQAVPWEREEVQIGVTGLSAPGMPVSISERVEGSGALEAQFRSLRDGFRAGGPLGIRDLAEIHVGTSDASRREAWQRVLGPATTAAGVSSLGETPAVRLVPSDRDEVVALIFQVQSLDRARQVLKPLGLLGESQGKTIAIDPGRSCGLKILFRE